MKIISVMGRGGGVGVTLTAAELAIEAQIRGQTVLAVDLSPTCGLRHDLTRAGWSNAGFSVIEDVAQLFRPIAETRWGRAPLPSAGLLCHSDGKPAWLTRGSDGRPAMVYRQTLGSADAGELKHLRDAIASLSGFYDVMIVDVPNSSPEAMAAFHDLSDEVRLLVREDLGGSDPEGAWLRYIDRENALAHPHVVVRGSRAGEVTDRNWGQWIGARESELA